MRFNLLSDADWDSRVDKVLSSLSDLGYRQFFEKKDYGSTLSGITVIFMCRNPEYKFKQRIKHSKKESRLYMDIMLDLNQFKEIDQKEREMIIGERLISEVPQIVAKYKFEDFDLPKFKSDLKRFLKKIEWVK